MPVDGADQKLKENKPGRHQRQTPQFLAVTPTKVGAQSIKVLGTGFRQYDDNYADERRVT